MTLPNITLKAYRDGASEPYLVNLADLVLKHPEPKADSHPLPDWMSLPSQITEGSVALVDIHDEATPLILDNDDLAGWLAQITPESHRINWSDASLVHDLELAVMFDHQDSAGRTVFMQALGADLALVGRLGINVDNVVYYGKAAAEQLALHDSSVADLVLRRAANMLSRSGPVQIVETPVLQWEHPDTGEGIGEALPQIWRDPLIMLSLLARALPRR